MRFRLLHLLVAMTITALLLCVFVWYRTQVDALHKAIYDERLAERRLYQMSMRETAETRDAERVVEQMLSRIRILKIQENCSPSPTTSSERMLIDNE